MKFIPNGEEFNTIEDFKKYEQETQELIEKCYSFGWKDIAKGLELMKPAYIKYKTEKLAKWKSWEDDGYEIVD